MVSYQMLTAAQCLLSMSLSDFDPNLLKVSPPSSTRGYDLWARDNAQAIAQQQANIYRMQLSAAEMAERQLEVARLQQAAQMQQQQYAYGWVDPKATMAFLEKHTEPDLNKVLWNIKPITWRPTKPQLFLFAGFALLLAGLLIKLIGN